jgi:hypothetical protein
MVVIADGNDQVIAQQHIEYNEFSLSWINVGGRTEPLIGRTTTCYSNLGKDA